MMFSTVSAPSAMGSILVRLGLSTWHSCRTDTNLEFVRSAFYLGISVLEIRSMAEDPAQSVDRKQIIAVARNLGINERDQVILDPYVYP